MPDQNTIDLMDHILVNFKWWEGFCDKGTARTTRHRHEKRILSLETYEKVFTFHGYTKVITWVRNTNN